MTFTSAVSVGITAFACCGVCPVNVTVAVCPRAVAVTVAGVAVAGTGGRYVTCPPLVPDRAPGPDSDQATSFASCGGLAVMSTGAEIVCAPDGEMLKVGWGSLPAQATMKTQAAANIRVRMDISAR